MRIIIVLAAAVLLVGLADWTLASSLPAGESAKAPAAVVTGNNRFAFDLYHELSETEGNLFLSPYSISLPAA
jgi:serine protease inhibitor